MLGSLDEDRTNQSFLTTPFLKEFKSNHSVDFLAKILIVGDSFAGKVPRIHFSMKRPTHFFLQ